MKKQYVVMIVFLIASMAFLTIRIIVGETQAEEMRIKKLTEDYLTQYAQLTGAKSLGVVDGYTVSQETGSIYNGQAIDHRLFEQNGLEYPINQFDFFIEETANGVLIFRKVVYEGEPKEPVWQQPVKEVFLYGIM